MKKLLPYLRLTLFCVVLFGAGGVIVLLKQQRLKLGKQHEETKEPTAGATTEGEKPAGETHAALPGLPEAGASSTLEKAPGDAARRQAVASGRALFSVPESISSSEATDLLNDLRRQKKENEERKSALDQREKELTLMEQDLEARRTALVAMAEKINAQLPAASEAAKDETIDPETITKIAGMFASMQPDMAAKALRTYTPEQAAKVLLAMKEAKAAAVLGQVSGEDDFLQKVTDALLREKSNQ
jgi:flagellar motility protein MotE (MotC chaperone)